MRRVQDDDSDTLALRHAEALLAALGVAGVSLPPAVDVDPPALAWRRAGLMDITGRPDGAPRVAPVALTAAADGALLALRALAPTAPLPPNGSVLLGERARRLGLTRGGRVSPNGGCRLIAARDGHVALNLPRPDDWELLPALFGAEAADWRAVERLAGETSCDVLVARGRLLGLAIAPEGAPHAAPTPFKVEQLGSPAARSGVPLVIDLSSLWAGPLAGALLQAAGARVVKVESLGRPDGARRGDADVYALLNGGKASVALDFRDARDLDHLRRLVDTADIVLESARPRALRALDLDSHAAAARGATWVSITAHGREGEAADWIGFGDDAAVAGGVAAAMTRAWDAPMFAGDAIADPLTGITAALAAWASWRAGGGRRVSLALSQVVAHACALHQADPDETRRWQAQALADTAPLYALRTPTQAARPLGADTASVLATSAPDPAQRAAKRRAASMRMLSPLK